MYPQTLWHTRPHTHCHRSRLRHCHPHTHTYRHTPLWKITWECQGQIVEEERRLLTWLQVAVKKKKPSHDPDLQCAATIAELIHLIYVLLWALRGPAAEEIVHWGCKWMTGAAEQLWDETGMRVQPWPPRRLIPFPAHYLATPPTPTPPPCVWCRRILIHPLISFIFISDDVVVFRAEH